MDQIIKALDSAIDDEFKSFEKLRTAAKFWATYCLEAMEGETLDKGLEISKAIVGWLNEVEANAE